MDLLSLCFISVAIAGQILISGRKPRTRTANLLYTISNLYFIGYFIWIQDWEYVLLYAVFTVFSVRGLVLNFRKTSKKVGSQEAPATSAPSAI